ncbi:hypothetical protein BWQ96_08014 [Gracilariopsis chorda]|uniref:Uncharacterized protein n=1 Tax=Gracilariopsis chorda TaxID=448386 RepID=A0A2V3IJM2_9FLOR|nr:hypothetical protein BWQ96_08014 [Gracilariopsis chorda]|eukprot:PXF42295.1 hypothetical protein BWQ96_08014 [Gracilariopsis chorda]
MALRPSLGTRGELRRIAAEAEAATIDRVRPWRRTTQACRLAPHVVIPQWIRYEHPPSPTEQKPELSECQMIVQDTIDALLEAATSKKVERAFRRGRGRRQLRRRPDEPDEESAADGTDLGERAASSRKGSVEPQFNHATPS